MDIAFSLDMKDIIDPEKAYELFWKGIITNKRNFECPDENCSAQVTCANIDKLEHNMKQGVHYRVIGKHSELCEFEALERKLTTELNNGKVRNNPNKKVNFDNFHLKRPDDYYKKKGTNISNLNFSKIERKRNLRNSYIESFSAPRNYYSIRPIVTKYLKLENHNNNFIMIKGKSLSYENFFSKISTTNFNDINEYPQIYFGEAYVNILENKNIQIRFKDGFIKNENDRFKTSIFINRETLELEKNSYWKKKIFKVADSRRCESKFFIYGKPNEYNGYVNFNIKNLDFLETRNNLP